jgi:hypothetical protein
VVIRACSGNKILRRIGLSLESLEVFQGALFKTESGIARQTFGV